jgi:predicted transposase YbfD/YdcC
MPPTTLLDHFQDLADPRVKRTRRHHLLDIVVITICAVIAGAESWDDIELFGETKADWLATFLALPNGIPSHDTFNRVFAALDPAAFRERFTAWMQSVITHLPAQVIAVDGKTVRGSADRFHDQAAIHLVSAWAATNRMILAQVKVDAKSNEITAIPDVLRNLVLSGCFVTLDAMGCQRAIAQQILDQGGEYVLALKDNQPLLAEEVRDAFAAADQYEDTTVLLTAWPDLEKRHGRLTRRTATLMTDPEVLAWLQTEHAWPGLTAVGRVTSERHIGETTTQDTRYYLLSRVLGPQALIDAVRSHWGIENQVHWVLDVTFGEDASRIRAGYAAENLAVVRHIALNLLRREPSRRSMKGKRLKAALDTAFLLRVLLQF